MRARGDLRFLRVEIFKPRCALQNPENNRLSPVTIERAQLVRHETREKEDATEIEMISRFVWLFVSLYSLSLMFFFFFYAMFVEPRDTQTHKKKVKSTKRPKKQKREKNEKNEKKAKNTHKHTSPRKKREERKKKRRYYTNSLSRL
jgi:hypothetical protein